MASVLVVMAVWAGAAGAGPEPKSLAPGVSKDAPLRISGASAIFNRKDQLCDFMGGVVMRHNESELLCETLRAFAEMPSRAERVEGRGRVRWSHPLQRATLLCEEFSYERSTEHLIARGSPRLIVVDEEGVPTVVDGERLDLFVGRQVTVVDRRVVITKGETKAWGEHMEYDYGREVAKLTGGARIAHGASEFLGLEVTAFLAERRIKLEGDVDARVVPGDTAEFPNSKKP